jgi:hypothetical protein
VPSKKVNHRSRLAYITKEDNDDNVVIFSDFRDKVREWKNVTQTTRKSDGIFGVHGSTCGSTNSYIDKFRGDLQSQKKIQMLMNLN